MTLTSDRDRQFQKAHQQNSHTADIGGIIRVHPELDDAILIERMTHASTILIQDTFFADFRRRLRDVLIARSKKGATIKLLLVDPNSPFALRRSKDINSGYLSSYVPMQVRFTRDDVMRLREDGAIIEMRFYNSLPSATQYICDEFIFFGILAHGERSDFTPQVEVYGEKSTMYQFLRGEFDTLWAEAMEEDKVNFDAIKD